jgi:hypothetical protein
MIVEPQWEIVPEGTPRSYASDLDVIEAELLPL